VAQAVAEAEASDDLSKSGVPEIIVSVFLIHIDPSSNVVFSSSNEHFPSATAKQPSFVF
jgi:hypothetical protein